MGILIIKIENNMKKALLFPGQASQYVGMAKDLYDASETVKNIFHEANEIVDFDLLDVCFNGPIEKLTETDITQPTVFTHSYAMFELLKEKGMTFDVVAGHSLGEFTALVAAEVLSFEDALKIVAKRGQLMKACNVDTQGTMAAVMKFGIDKIEEALSEVDGIVQVANYNSDAQIVISGEVSAVRSAMQKIKEKGARIVKELQVGGAFHSPLMKPAEDELAKIINETTFSDAAYDVYANVTATAVRKADETKKLSINQLTSSVRWFETINNMYADGVRSFTESGPGTVLSGLAKRMKLSDSEVNNFDKLSDLEKL
jgi:[acyl-carrier-protein] S-malonyltransferase